MSSAAVVTPQMTTAEKIDVATQQAAKITEIFAPQAAAAIEAGVAAEPVIRGIAQLIVGLFHHHIRK